MLDHLLLFYLLWCAVKGYRRRLGQEIEGFIFALLILGMLLGIFVISQLTGLIKLTFETFLLSTGFIATFISFIIALMIFFFLRKKIAEIAESRYSENVSRNGGILAGLLRGLVVTMIMIIVLSQLPFNLLAKTIEDSLIASQIYGLLKNKIEDPTSTDTPPAVKNESEAEELIIGY